MTTAILIPARLGSSRLKHKALADIHGKPMIQHVLERALQADLGPVVLACDHEDIAGIGRQLGVPTVLTDPSLPSGSDRIHKALDMFDPEEKYQKIINLQGDLPTLDPDLIGQVLKPLNEGAVDIGTLACLIKHSSERDNPNVVKVALAGPEAPSRRALYFSRSPIPHGPGPHYHHIGLYAYRRASLKAFIALPPSPLEQQEKLEQLRALEAGLRIDVQLVSTVPLGVDSAEDLCAAREALRPLPPAGS